MEIIDIANQLAEGCRQLKFMETRKKLFAENAISIEADGKPIAGLEALEAKNKTWQESIDKLYDLQISVPLVNGNFFSIAFTWDLAYKNQPRYIWHEIGLFQVKEGRVVREQFFYD